MTHEEGMMKPTYESRRSLATSHELTAEDVLAQVQKIQQVMSLAMKQDEHYGVIPGTGQKPTLLKAGAEKLLLLFRLDPEYEVTETADGAHRTYQSKCTLYHIPTGNRMGSGMGSCSTKESKYAYRQAKRVCPKCGQETIHQSKFPSKGQPQSASGWYCYKKLGGCGLEFAANDSAIINQPIGRVPNPELADSYNTVLKMSNKRSLIAAVLNVTAASDIFTQDLEDYTPPDKLRALVVADEPMTINEAWVRPVGGSIDHGLPREAVPVVQDDTAPAQEWVQALADAQSKKAHDHLKAGLRKAWPTFSQDDKSRLEAAVKAGEDRWAKVEGIVVMPRRD